MMRLYDNSKLIYSPECVVFGVSTDAKPAPINGHGFLELDTGNMFRADGAQWVNTTASGPGGAAWGAITGTLSDQGDLQTALNAKLSSVATAWPVGSVFTSVVATNPATLLGFGTWAAFGAGRVLVGLDAGQTEFDTVKETGGAKTVTLTAAQSGLPQHTHIQDAHAHTQRRNNVTTGANTGWTTAFDTSSSSPVADANTGTGSTTATNQNAGPTDAAQAHSNLQPYIVVYFWERTA